MNQINTPSLRGAPPDLIQVEQDGKNPTASMTADYQGVISQIKKEVLIEIRNYSQSRAYSGDFNTLSNRELARLLETLSQEARARGLPAPANQPGNITQAGISQTIMAVLLFPAARQKLGLILDQTIQDGLGLVRQAGSLLENTVASIAAMTGDQLY